VRLFINNFLTIAAAAGGSDRSSSKEFHFISIFFGLPIFFIVILFIDLESQASKSIRRLNVLTPKMYIKKLHAAVRAELAGSVNELCGGQKKHNNNKQQQQQQHETTMMVVCMNVLCSLAISSPPRR